MAGKAVDYTPRQVTTALMQLAANAGNVAKTVRDVASDVGVTEGTLRAWKNDVHSEQYRRIEETYGQQLEHEAIQRARARLAEADEAEGELLQKVRESKGDLVPQALRAVADVKAKNGNLLMQLTGRPVAPRDQSGGDVVKLLQTMVDKGYLRMAPEVQASVDATVVDG